MRDLGVSMSSNCTFDFHISNLYKRCSNLAGWILRTFTTRDPQVMLTLYKTLVMSRLEYASQLWSPYLWKHVYLIEKVQRAFSFTKHHCSFIYAAPYEWNNLSECIRTSNFDSFRKSVKTMLFTQQYGCWVKIVDILLLFRL